MKIASTVLLSFLTISCANAVPKSGSSVASADQAGDKYGAFLTVQQKCEKDGKAYLPKVNGQPNGGCGDELVTWCCKEEEILARFPGASTLLKAKFKAQTDAGFKILECSKNAAGNVVHFLKVSDSGLGYATVDIKGLTETDTGNAAACPVPFGDLVGAKAKATATASNSKDGYDAVASLLVSGCGGGACHDKGHDFPIPFVGDKTQTKQLAATLLRSMEDGRMPPAPKSGEKDRMTDDEKTELETYLKAAGS